MEDPLIDSLPNPFSTAMGALIRQAREELGMSQRTLAHRLQRRQSSVSLMEHGRMEPHASTLVQLADVLEKPITYFIPPPWGPRVARGDLSYDEQALLLEYRRLEEDEHRQIVINQVAALAAMFQRRQR